MTRFIDELEKSDPRQAHMARLLEAGEPLHESEVSRERVRRALRQVEIAPARARLRPALAVALLFGLVGTAGATWGVARLVQAPAAVPPTGSAKGVGSAPGTEGKTHRKEPTTTSTDGKKTSSPTNKDEGVPEAGVSPPSSPSVERLEGPSKVAPKPSSKSQPSPPSKNRETHASELVLLHRATEALRSGKDPKKAAELLQQYEATRSSGALDEEALALRLEAALANRDPKTASIARDYLKRFPKGRFRPLAQRALSEHD